MENFNLGDINPNANVGIPADARGLIRKFQQNVELSYEKWKVRYKEIESCDLEKRNDGLYYDLGETEPFTGLSHEDMDKGDGWFQRRSIHLLKGKIMLETFKDIS